MPVVSIFFANSYQNLETTISVQGEGHGTGLRLELSTMSAQHNQVQVIGVKGLLLHSNRDLSKLCQSASQGSNKTHKVNNLESFIWTCDFRSLVDGHLTLLRWVYGYSALSEEYKEEKS